MDTEKLGKEIQDEELESVNGGAIHCGYAGGAVYNGGGPSASRFSDLMADGSRDGSPVQLPFMGSGAEGGTAQTLFETGNNLRDGKVTPL